MNVCVLMVTNKIFLIPDSSMHASMLTYYP